MISSILVAGRAGFVGSHLVGRLMNEGANFIVLDDFSGGRHKNLSSHLDEPNFCLAEGDVRNETDVKRALDIMKSCANLSKAEKLLGYRPKISLIKGLTVLLRK